LTELKISKVLGVLALHTKTLTNSQNQRSKCVRSAKDSGCFYLVFSAPHCDWLAGGNIPATQDKTKKEIVEEGMID
jgi:hypothetical protein